MSEQTQTREGVIEGIGSQFPLLWKIHPNGAMGLRQANDDREDDDFIYLSPAQAAALADVIRAGQGGK